MKKILNSGSVYRITICLLIMLMAPIGAVNGETRANKSPMGPTSGWSLSTSGGYLHQLEADIDDGGSFSVNRFSIQAGPAYTTENFTGIRLSVGYGFDEYDFSGTSGFGGRKPWDDIHTMRLSIPIRWRMSQKWTGFISPSVRSSGEKGADFSDTLTGGGFAGFSYRFSDRLTIGPGVGVMTKLEDSTSFIPLLVFNWKINDTLSFGTGRGGGAVAGPGLALDWRPSRSWSFSFGGRYKSHRFRLDENGDVPNGIGVDRAFPIFVGVEHSFTPVIRMSLIGGVDIGGELGLEDENGQSITEADRDPGGFVGFAFSARF